MWGVRAVSEDPSYSLLRACVCVCWRVRASSLKFDRLLHTSAGAVKVVGGGATRLISVDAQAIRVAGVEGGRARVPPGSPSRGGGRARRTAPSVLQHVPPSCQHAPPQAQGAWRLWAPSWEAARRRSHTTLVRTAPTERREPEGPQPTPSMTQLQSGPNPNRRPPSAPTKVQLLGAAQGSCSFYAVYDGHGGRARPPLYRGAAELVEVR